MRFQRKIQFQDIYVLPWNDEGNLTFSEGGLKALATAGRRAALHPDIYSPGMYSTLGRFRCSYATIRGALHDKIQSEDGLAQARS